MSTGNLTQQSVYDLLLEEANKLICGCVKWLIKKQSVGESVSGGFSPYPGTVKMPGTLASADFITALADVSCLRNDSEIVTYIKYLKAVRGEDRLGNPKSALQSLLDVISFLSKVQVEANGRPDGGFPPLGDIIYISKVSFADATADAVLGLMAGWDLVSILSEDYSSNLAKLKREVQVRINRGIAWIIENATFNDGKVFWTSTKYHRDARIFPTWLCCLALDVYLKEVDNHFPMVKDNDVVALRKILDAGLGFLTGNLQHGFLRIASGDASAEESMTNTAHVVRLLLSINEDSKSRLGADMVKGSIEQAMNWLYAHASKMPGTDVDQIDLTPVWSIEPTVPSNYDATYSRLQAMLSTLLDIKRENVMADPVFIQGLNDLVKGINDHPYYCLEQRSGPVAATSATASAIFLFRHLLAAFERRVELPRVTLERI